MNHVAMLIEFETDKFKLSGELPEDINAGNQFYGEDFSKWFCSELKNWDSGFIDEDWGWCVFVINDQETDVYNEICIYAYPDKKQVNDYGEWNLIIHTRYRVPFFNFFKRLKYGEVNERLANNVLSLLESIDCNNLRAKKCTMDISFNITDEKKYDWKSPN